MRNNNLLKELKHLIKKYEELPSNHIDPRLRSLAKFDEKEILTGLLPKIFLNKKVFPGNKEIIKFANKGLKLNISPRGKRSKAELIGKIIVELHMSASNNKKISKVTNKLLELIKGEPNRKTEKNGEKFFSKWNKLIKDMDV